MQTTFVGSTPLLYGKHSPAPRRRIRPNNNQVTCARLSGAQLVASAVATTLLLTPFSADGYGLINGRLEKCRGDDPCVSTTSVGNPTKFGAPWSFKPETDDGDVAWESLKEAITNNSDGGTIVELMEDPGMNSYYLRAEFPSFIRGIDDVEFKLMKKDKLVLYRSSGREAIFIYPLQTPINSNKNRTRLEEIRNTLGWSVADELEN